VILKLATRGSALALWQAERTRDLLQARHTGLEVELVIVQSSGDQDRATELASFGRTGIFTVEVDRAVVEGRADVGVHSLKDLTTTPDEGVTLAATMERGSVEDAILIRAGHRLDDLPQGARVATGSRRRQALLLRQRPDLEVVGIRGNVGTRIEKLDSGAADALLLACAGLERLGLGERITQALPRDSFVPAVGQGIVGWTVREDDDQSNELVQSIGDASSWVAATAERALLRRLEGGCHAAIGGHARVREDRQLELHAIVLSGDGSRVLERRGTGDPSTAEQLGLALANELLDAGAAELVAETRA